jgi:hypothetical protein
MAMVSRKTRSIKLKSGIVTGFGISSKYQITLDTGDVVTVDLNSQGTPVMFPVFSQSGEKYIQKGDVLIKRDDKYYLMDSGKFNELFESE